MCVSVDMFVNVYEHAFNSGTQNYYERCNLFNSMVPFSAGMAVLYCFYFNCSWLIPAQNQMNSADTQFDHLQHRCLDRWRKCQIITKFALQFNCDKTTCVCQKEMWQTSHNRMWSDLNGREVTGAQDKFKRITNKMGKSSTRREKRIEMTTRKWWRKSNENKFTWKKMNTLHLIDCRDDE